ncbi:MAG: hypothetical protein K2J31_05110 [Alistipes sp.]|nr:hypothetical protein [Alistipes sp.]MDE6862103.1 hypothetical protein [Alistipes sp.]
MKLIKMMMCVACAISLAVACDKSDNDYILIPVDNTFSGELSVDQTDGTFFRQQDVELRYEMNIDDVPLTMDIYMYRVQFAEAMPVKLDMTIPGVDFSYEGGAIEIEGEGIVPLAMGGEFPAYTITGLRGKIENGRMTLSMTCGKYPLTYTGTAMYDYDAE